MSKNKRELYGPFTKDHPDPTKKPTSEIAMQKRNEAMKTEEWQRIDNITKAREEKRLAAMEAAKKKREEDEKKKRYGTEYELIKKVASGEADEVEKISYNYYKRVRERETNNTLYYLNKNIDDFTKEYNSLAGKNFVSAGEYDKISKNAEKINESINRAIEYYELYGSEDDIKEFEKLRNNFSNIMLESNRNKKIMSQFKDENEYNAAKEANGITSYTELRQKRGQLQRQKGIGNDDVIQSKLDALDKYGLNSDVIKSMSEEDWNFEKERINSALSNAQSEHDRYNTKEYINAHYEDAVNKRGLSEEAAREELQSIIKNAGDKVEYYSGLLDEVTELARTKEVEIKWSVYEGADDFQANSFAKKDMLSDIEAKRDKGEISNFEDVYYTINRGKSIRGKNGLPVAATSTQDATYSFMTDRERRIFNYLYNTEGEAGALEYLTDLQSLLNKKYIQNRAQKSYEWGNKNPIVALGLNILEATAQAVEAPFKNVSKAIEGAVGEIDPYSLDDVSHYTLAARKQGGADHYDGGKRTAYRIANNIGEMLGIMLVSRGVGKAAGGVSAANEAATIANKVTSVVNATLNSSRTMYDTTMQYKQNGESDINALGMGVIAGIIEAATEKWSMDNILKMPDILKDASLVRKLGAYSLKGGRDFLTEGSEEVASNLLNTLAAFITDNRDNDEFLSAFDNARRNGETSWSAFAAAVKEVAPEYLETFVIGGFAGGIFGAANTVSSVHTYNQVRDDAAAFFKDKGYTKTSVMDYLIRNGVSEVAEIARLSDAIVNRASGKTIDDTEIKESPFLSGVLMSYVEGAGSGETANKTNVKKSVKEEISALTDIAIRDVGRTGTAVHSELSEYVVSNLMQDGMTQEDANKIAESMFELMYKSGKYGVKKEEALTSGAELYSDKYADYMSAFYSAGVTDANNQVIGKKTAKLIKNDALYQLRKEKTFSRKAERVLNAIASKLGVDIEIVSELPDGDNALWNETTGRLLISAKSKNPIITAAVHDGVHAIRSIDSEAYNTLAALTVEILGKNSAVLDNAMSERLMLYREEATGEDGKINPDYITEEMVAEVLSHTLNLDESFINEMAQSDRRLVQRIFDAIGDFFERLFKRYTGEKQSDMSPEIKEAVDMLRAESEKIKSTFGKALEVTKNKQRTTMKLPKSGRVMNSKTITVEDVKFIQSIGRKSINALTEEELKKLNSIAEKYWQGMSEETRIKSPFFRRWFGDWREFDVSPVKVLDMKPGALDNSKRNIYNKDLKNKIKIEPQVFNDSLHYANIHKDTNAVKALLANIDDIIAESILLNSKISEKNKGSKKGNTLLMHSFYVAVEYNKAPFIAELTVEEYLGEGGNLTSRAYNLQRIKMSDLPRGHMATLNDSHTEKLRLKSDEITVSDLFSLVKTYDTDFKPVKCSAVLNEDGTPKKVYHGTSNGGFSSFDTYGYYARYGLFGNGAYFTENREVAEQYTNKGKGDNKQVYNVYVNIKNPLDMDKKADIKAWRITAEKNDLSVNLHEGMTNEEAFREIEKALTGEMIPKYEGEEIIRYMLESMGHDGITHIGGGRVNDDGVRHRVWIAFEPNQIKSPDNRGTFSSWDNNIYHAKSTGLKKSRRGGKINTMYEFPPYNISKSQANEIATRWAHRDDVKEYDVSFVSYHGNMYLIEKNDNSDMGYRIVKKLNAKEYREILKERAGENSERISETSDMQIYEQNRQIDTDRGIELGSSMLLDEYERENGYVYGMDEDQSQGGYIRYERNGDDTHSNTNRSLESKDEFYFKSIESEGNVRKSKPTKNTEQFRVMWTLEEGVLSRSEVSAFYAKISEMKKQRYPNYKLSKDGEYIFEVGNKLIYSDGDYDYPEITKVVVFNSEFEDEIYCAKEVFWNGEEDKSGIEMSITVVEAVYGEKFVTVANFENSRAYEREVRRGKRENSRASDSRSGENVRKSKVSEIDSTSEDLPKISATVLPAINLDEKTQAKLNELIKKYGGMEGGFNPARNVIVPEKTSDDNYVRRFARTAVESDKVNDEAAVQIMKDIADGEFWTTYERVGNKKSQEAAKVKLEQDGFEKMLREWEATLESGKKLEKQDIVNAQLLLEVAAENGNTELVVRLVSEIAAEATRAGQVVQSMLLLKRLGTAANVYKVERVVSELQRDLIRHKGKKAPKLEIPDELLEEYAEAFDIETRNGDNDHSESDRVADEIYKAIAEQIPSSWIDKLSAWRYLAMLGNPRTHIRNMVGNLAFAPAIMIKNIIATTGETLFIRNIEKRTKSFSGLFSKGSEYQYAKADADAISSVLRGDGKYGETDLITQHQQIIKTKWLDSLRKFNTNLLEKEDWLFLKPHYARALTMYMKAHKLSGENITAEQLDKARKIAIQEAKKATFRDASALASWLSLSKKTHPLVGFGVDSVMPFKKTPINVLKRGVEYSPLGILKPVAKGLFKVGEGKYTAAELIDDLAASLSGSGLMVLGLWLASTGILKGRGSDDEEENILQTLGGMQNYSLKIGDGTYTIDWLAPSAMAMFVGCELYNAFKEGDMTFADIMEALPRITEPVFEMSMLESLSSLVERASYEETSSAKLGAIVADLPASYLGQFVPTLLGQIARTIDGTRRKIYIDKESGVPDWIQSFVQQQAKKIPGITYLLEPYINARGEQELNAEGNVFSRAIQNFVSPGYYKKIRSTAVDDEMARLYGELGENASGVMPKTVQKYITVDGERINLSAEQYSEYQRTTGQSYYKKLGEIISSDYYKALTDEQKVDLLEKAKNYSVEVGKNAALPEYKITNGWLKTAFETDGGFQYILDLDKKESFSEKDLQGESFDKYESDRDTMFDNIISNYKPSGSNYELADKYYDNLYSFTHRVALEKNANGKYAIDTKWMKTAKALSPKDQAEFIYGTTALSLKDFKEYKDALGNTVSRKQQVCEFIGRLNISNKIKSYLFREEYKDRTSKGKSNIDEVTWQYEWLQ